jgi:protein MBA1
MVLKLQEFVTNAALKYSSKPSFFKRATFQPKRSALVPTAKALHRSLAEALAAGDKQTLNNICSRKLVSPLLASIDARPRGRRYAWELVKYTNKLVYPSIKSHRLSPISRDRHAPIIRQAIVAISSKQRRVVYDAADQVIPGSEKEMDVVEHFAIASIVDPKNNWHQSEWRVIGTVQPTTLESWLEEKELLQQNLTG